MTDTMKFAGFAILSAVVAYLLRSLRKEIGAAAALAGGLMLLLFALRFISPAAESLVLLSQRAGLKDETVHRLLRLIGIAYITEFSAQLCADAGEAGLGAKAAFCGKMLLMAQTVPLILEIGEITLKLIG